MNINIRIYFLHQRLQSLMSEINSWRKWRIFSSFLRPNNRPTNQYFRQSFTRAWYGKFPLINSGYFNREKCAFYQQKQPSKTNPENAFCCNGDKSHCLLWLHCVVTDEVLIRTRMQRCQIAEIVHPFVCFFQFFFINSIQFNFYQIPCHYSRVQKNI